MATKIKIERYKNPANVDGWAGYIEPKDQAWILYYKDSGETKFYPERDCMTGAVLEPDAPTRRFIIWRHEDQTGVSGTGLVAYGWEREDGRATVRWLGEHRTETLHEGGMASVEAIHGHSGATSIVGCDDGRLELPARALRPYAAREDIIALTRAPDRSGWILGLDGHSDKWAEVKAEPAESWADDALVGRDYLVHGELIEGFVIDDEQRLLFEESGGTLLGRDELPGGNKVETWSSCPRNPRIRRDLDWHEVVELLAKRPTHAVVTRLTPSCGGDPAYHRIKTRGLTG
jgi:hypothetical protein